MRPGEVRQVVERLPRLENAGQVALGSYRFPRLALGAMRLLSSNARHGDRVVECFADPENPQANRDLIHAAIRECGIGYVDFARGYGARPGNGERLFRDWMAPFWDNVLWGTKAGYERDAQGGWLLNLGPDFLRSEVQACLDLLGSPIPLLYLTAGSTSDVIVKNRPKSLLDCFAPLTEAQQRGQVSHLGVANVGLEELKQLLDITPISVVQNKFTVASLAQPAQRAVLDLCADRGIPFVVWGVFQSDDESPWVPGQALLQAARDLSVTPQEASIAILLAASPNLVVLTGASRPESLASSVRAANLLIPEEISRRFDP